MAAERRLFAKAVQMLDRAGARVIAFDLLFAERESSVSNDLRGEAQAAASALSETQNPRLRQALARLAEDDPDGEFAATLRASGKVLLPFALLLSGGE